MAVLGAGRECAAVLFVMADDGRGIDHVEHRFVDADAACDVLGMGVVESEFLLFVHVGVVDAADCWAMGTSLFDGRCVVVDLGAAPGVQSCSLFYCARPGSEDITLAIGKVRLGGRCCWMNEDRRRTRVVQMRKRSGEGYWQRSCIWQWRRQGMAQNRVVIHGRLCLGTFGKSGHVTVYLLTPNTCLVVRSDPQ